MSDYRPCKPMKALEYERKIAAALSQHPDLTPDIIAAIPGYTPAQIPFIYGTPGHEVFSGSPQYYMQKITSVLWMGTIVPVENLVGYHLDQITGVRVQWWGHNYPDGSSDCNRLEITPADNGVFVHREYENVSGMGEFDGDLRRLSIHLPIDKNWIFDGMPRRDWRIHYVSIGGTVNEPQPHVNMRSSNVSGVTVLNALPQLIQFHRNEVTTVKYVGAAAYADYSEEGNPIQIPVDLYKA
jgi:hypothetical protein